MPRTASMIETLERTGADFDFLRETTVSIQEADTPDGALDSMIERVCAFRKWPLGHAYSVSADGHLERSPSWYVHDRSCASLPESIEKLPVPDGIGLAERVVQLAEPQWTRGLGENPHIAIGEAARRTGLTTAFAFPISVNLTVKAVIEFFSRSKDAPEQAFLAIMSALCIQLGRTLERQQLAQLEATNRELASTNARLQQALAGVRHAAPTEDREQSRFLTNMGHEFRTPLTAILGFSELLLAEAESTGQKGQIEDLDRIHQAASGLLELVDGIIDLSRAQADQLDLQVTEFELSDLVHALCESIRASFEEKGNVLKLDCEDEIGCMRTDPQKVRQCLKQLLTNANKFTENGSVEITVSRRRVAGGDRIVFRVSDTGIGMTHEQTTRLFQPFSQADSSAARRHGGAGLGLALTENLVRLLGGTVRVDSVLGEGTTFSLELPAEASPCDGEGNDNPGKFSLSYRSRGTTGLR